MPRISGSVGVAHQSLGVVKALLIASALCGLGIVAAEGAAHAEPARNDTDESEVAPTALGLASDSYRLSLNIGWFDVDTVDPGEVLARDGAISASRWADFDSDFFLDVHARRGSLRLTSFDNELAIACDLRVR